MPFTTTLETRERILLYGEPGTGKSKQIIEIAKFLKATRSSSHMYVVDNDRSYKLMVAANNVSDYVTVYEVYDYQDYIKAKAAIMPKLKTYKWPGTDHLVSDDFYVCDLMSELWDTTQTYYTEKVFKGDMGAYFLTVALNPKQDTEFDGWTDWKVINKLYFDFAKPFVYQSPCHVIACSSATAVVRKKDANAKVGDDKETVSIFGSVGYRPDGQKRLKHQFNTTIFMHKNPRGEFVMTSVKDRERELFSSKRVNNFAIDYLKGVAGWQMT